MCDGNLIQPSPQYYIGFVSKRKLVCHNVAERGSLLFLYGWIMW